MAETQQVIPGSVDAVSVEVAVTGKAYISTLALRQAMQKKEDTLRAELVALTEAEGVEEFVVGDKRIVMVTTSKTKPVVTTIKEN